MVTSDASYGPSSSIGPIKSDMAGGSCFHDTGTKVGDRDKDNVTGTSRQGNAKASSSSTQ
uniref:Uncharacterized protein n=1 Tax=Leersia perrieri TaxID=77586 RepID=A0A0D9VC09_9ORYZ